MNALRNDSRFGITSDIDAMLRECKDLARSITALRPPPAPLMDLNMLMPSRRIADELVAHYFRVFESCYRVLHEQSFYRAYNSYWQNPQQSNDTFVSTLLLVMAMGSTFYKNARDELPVRAKAKEWVLATQQWLNRSSEKRQFTLGHLQSHCLLLIARHVCAVDSDLVWVSAGALVRSAIQMGYHREPSLFPEVSVYEGELRRRIWATITELNVQSAIDSGMPAMLSEDDFDCEPPANLDDADFDENTMILPEPKSPFIATQSSFQILLLRSLPTRLEIARILNDFRLTPTYEQTLELGSEMTTHILETTTFLETATPCPGTLRSKLVDLHIRRFLLVLHIPFALCATQDPHFAFSRKLALETSIHMLSYSEDCQSPDAHTSTGPPMSVADDFARMRFLCAGIFGGTPHPHMILDLEFIRLTEEYLHTGIQKLTPRSQLHHVARSTVYMARRRLEMDETNVKDYVYSSMTHAKIAAMERAEDQEEAMLTAARRTSHEALEILRFRLAQEQACAQRNRVQHDEMAAATAAAAAAATAATAGFSGSQMDVDPHSHGSAGMTDLQQQGYIPWENMMVCMPRASLESRASSIG